MSYRGSLVCRDRRRVEFNVEAKVTLVVHLYSSLHLNLGYIYLNHQRTKICELSHFLKVKGANIIVLSFPFVHLLPECSTLLQSWNSFPLAFVNHPASLQISVTHCIFNLLSFAHQPTQCTSLPSSSPLLQVYSLIGVLKWYWTLQVPCTHIYEREEICPCNSNEEFVLFFENRKYSWLFPIFWQNLFLPYD